MNLHKLMTEPLSCINFDEIHEILSQESYIAAAELDSPNSPDFERLREKMLEKYTHDFYRALSLEVFKNSNTVKEYGPRIRVAVFFRVETKSEHSWITHYTSDKVNLCVERAQSLRRADIEQELEGKTDDERGQT